MTSSGIGADFSRAGSSGCRPTSTRVSNASIASVSPLNTRWITSKLERLKLSIRLSMVIQSPWVEATWNFARVSTIGMPTRPYFRTMSCLEKPAASNMIEVESSNISK